MADIGNVTRRGIRPAVALAGLGLVIASLAHAEVAAGGEVAEIERVAFDYVDGQLDGDAARVAKALHPDLAKRAIVGEGPSAREFFPLRRMSADELIQLTSAGALKTPRSQWRRDVRVLEVNGNVAVARVETPWFVDYFHLGRFGTRWLIVNALWSPKPAPGHAPATQTN